MASLADGREEVLSVVAPKGCDGQETLPSLGDQSSCPLARHHQEGLSKQGVMLGSCAFCAMVILCPFHRPGLVNPSDSVTARYCKEASAVVAPCRRGNREPNTKGHTEPVLVFSFLNIDRSLNRGVKARVLES